MYRTADQLSHFHLLTHFYLRLTIDIIGDLKRDVNLFNA